MLCWELICIEPHHLRSVLCVCVLDSGKAQTNELFTAVLFTTLAWQCNQPPETRITGGSQQLAKSALKMVRFVFASQLLFPFLAQKTKKKKKKTTTCARSSFSVACTRRMALLGAINGVLPMQLYSTLLYFYFYTQMRKKLVPKLCLRPDRGNYRAQKEEQRLERQIV